MTDSVYTVVVVDHVRDSAPVCLTVRVIAPDARSARIYAIRRWPRGVVAGVFLGEHVEQLALHASESRYVGAMPGGES